MPIPQWTGLPKIGSAAWNQMVDFVNGLEATTTTLASGTGTPASVVFGPPGVDGSQLPDGTLIVEITGG